MVVEPGMCACSLFGNREISSLACRRMDRSASGRRGAVADDERTGEVRLRHSVRWAARCSGGLKSLWRSDEGRHIRKRG
ncbi:hypothetical protein FSB64_41530 [Paraburkholderia sp. JPY454]|uniref:Uncharacterized protein n=1 Tax=Paraburkholderia youngii TaxID=2782701 RepID=A0ABX2NZB7_9BURK|nr:hypothetical protein [Paraburkholderia youngii]